MGDVSGMVGKYKGNPALLMPIDHFLDTYVFPLYEANLKSKKAATDEEKSFAKRKLEHSHIFFVGQLLFLKINNGLPDHASHIQKSPLRQAVKSLGIVIGDLMPFLKEDADWKNRIVGPAINFDPHDGDTQYADRSSRYFAPFKHKTRAEIQAAFCELFEIPPPKPEEFYNTPVDEKSPFSVKLTEAWVASAGGHYAPQLIEKMRKAVRDDEEIQGIIKVAFQHAVQVTAAEMMGEQIDGAITHDEAVITIDLTDGLCGKFGDAGKALRLHFKDHIRCEEVNASLQERAKAIIRTVINDSRPELF